MEGGCEAATTGPGAGWLWNCYIKNDEWCQLINNGKHIKGICDENPINNTYELCKLERQDLFFPF